MSIERIISRHYFLPQNQTNNFRAFILMQPSRWSCLYLREKIINFCQSVFSCLLGEIKTHHLLKPFCLPLEPSTLHEAKPLRNPFRGAASLCDRNRQDCYQKPQDTHGQRYSPSAQGFRATCAPSTASCSSGCTRLDQTLIKPYCSQWAWGCKPIKKIAGSTKSAPKMASSSRW